MQTHVGSQRVPTCPLRPGILWLLACPLLLQGPRFAQVDVGESKVPLASTETLPGPGGSLAGQPAPGAGEAGLVALPPAPTSGQEWTKWAFPQRLLLFPQPHLRDWPRPAQPRRPRRVPPCVPGCLLGPWVPTQEARQPFICQELALCHQVWAPGWEPGQSETPSGGGRVPHAGREAGRAVWHKRHDRSVSLLGASHRLRKRELPAASGGSHGEASIKWNQRNLKQSGSNLQ